MNLFIDSIVASTFVGTPSDDTDTCNPMKTKTICEHQQKRKYSSSSNVNKKDNIFFPEVQEVYLRSFWMVQAMSKGLKCLF